MNEPVRVELVFPRSGQQLFVNVPRHFAASDYMHYSDRPSQASGPLFHGSGRPSDERAQMPRPQ